MINAGVFAGNLALIRPQPTAAYRDMVVAMVDDEVKLKWFHHEGVQNQVAVSQPKLPSDLYRTTTEAGYAP